MSMTRQAAAPARSSAPSASFSQLAVPYTAPLQTIAYDGGTRSPVPLWMRPDGYVGRFTFNVTLNGTYGTAAPTGVDALAQFAGPIDRIEIRNTAISDLYNLSGEMAGLFTFLDRWYNITGLPFSTLSTFNAAPGTVAFADVWQFDIPMAVTLMDYPTPVGLYPAGFLGPPPVINIYFRPTNAGTPAAPQPANPGAGVYVPAATTTGPNPTGSVDGSQHGFGPILDAGAQPASDLVHRFREGSVPVNGNQQYEIQLLQGAFYGRIILMLITNGALNPITNFSRLQFEFGAQSLTRDMNAGQLGIYMASRWGAQLPNTVFVLDTYTMTHSVRDWINSAAMTQPRIVVTLSGCTFGGAQNQIRWAAEEFAPAAVLAAH